MTDFRYCGGSHKWKPQIANQSRRGQNKSNECGARYVDQRGRKGLFRLLSIPRKLFHSRIVINLFPRSRLPSIDVILDINFLAFFPSGENVTIRWIRNWNSSLEQIQKAKKENQFLSFLSASVVGGQTEEHKRNWNLLLISGNDVNEKQSNFYDVSFYLIFMTFLWWNFRGPFLFLPSSARQFTEKSMPDDKSVGGAASVWLGIHLINQTSLVEVMYIISPINSGEYLREKYAKLRGLRPLLSMLHNTPANIRGGNKFFGVKTTPREFIDGEFNFFFRGNFFLRVWVFRFEKKCCCLLWVSGVNWMFAGFTCRGFTIKSNELSSMFVARFFLLFHQNVIR